MKRLLTGEDIVRRLGGHLWIWLLLLYAVPSAAQPLNCTASASSASIRLGSNTERVSDILVTCTGGTPSGNGVTVAFTSISISFSSPVTSRVLAQNWSEALLIVDEPAVGNQRFCATDNGVCPMIGTGTGVGTYNGTINRPNIFQGTLANSTTLVWPSVPFDPPGSGQRRFRFTNLRVSTAGLEDNSTVVADISLGQFPINQPQQFVGIALNPVNVSPTNVQFNGSAISSFSLSIQEALANALRKRSSAGTGPAAQAQPGGVPFTTETGFFNPNLPQTPRGDAGTAGRPDSGTRLGFRFTNIPTSATISAPLQVLIGGDFRADLIQTDATGLGSGVYTPATSTALPNVNGIVTAFYEVVEAQPSLETVAFPFTVTYAAGASPLTNVTGSVALAPVNDPSNPLPIPRFQRAYPFNAGVPLSIVTQTLPIAPLGIPYSQPVQAQGGVPPYVFTLASGNLPPGLQLQLNGTLSGTPTVIGSSTFTIRATDAANATASKTLGMTVAPPSAPFQTSSAALRFTAIAGGALPPAQAFSAVATQGAQAFQVNVDGGPPNLPAPDWIHVTPLSGPPPVLLTVSVDQGSLPPGTYNARIRISVPNQGALPIVDVTVTLVVEAPGAPKLEALPRILRFNTRLVAPEKKVEFVLLRNTGSASPIDYQVTLLRNSPWITGLSPKTGTAGAKIPGLARITVDSNGLAAGIYRDIIRFSWSGGVLEVPVVLRVWPSGPVLTTNKRGVFFRVQQGSTVPQSRNVEISNLVPQSSLPWSAEVIRGTDWFAISPANGSATLASPSNLKINLQSPVTNLRPGNYFGLVRINAPGALNSPQYVTIALGVRPPAESNLIDLDPGGAILATLQGSGQRAVGSIEVSTSSVTPISYQAAVTTFNGGNWLAAQPTNGSTSSDQSGVISLIADPGNLAPGVYMGQLTVAGPANVQTATIAFVVLPAASDVPGGARSAGCVASAASVLSTGLANNFAVPAGWPAALNVQVRDNCGASIPNATVVASFSNGDPPLTLDPDGVVAGAYAATWQPGAAVPQMSVTINAFAGDLQSGSMALSGGVVTNTAPGIDPGGVVNPRTYELGGLLTPGSPVAVFGHGLASVAESTFVPLPAEYKGTSALVGPYEVPLFYVNPALVNVQFPWELTPDRTYPVVIIANGAITLPEPVDVVGLQPTVLAFDDGRLIAQHTDFTLVDQNRPAKRGEFLQIYLIGLGDTDVQVQTGAPSPSNPLARPKTTVTMTVGGQPVDVAFAGLAPTAVGLFQINFKVPDDAPLNTPLEIVVQQGGKSSNVSTLTVVP